ncbi:MAG: DUF3288 family protein [Cyanobacteriota bacterium]|jgi:hypothetical protein|nr:DUF3288 family protein [Cyanobacteriota bacterium]
MHDQSHPLYSSDRDTVDRLLAASSPADDHLVDAARLLMRYEGFPGARDLQDDLARVLRHWGLNRQELQQRTRAIWAAGFRPSAGGESEAVGSGFDSADQDG